MSAFHRYSDLPVEVQLNVLDNLEFNTLNNALLCNREVSELTKDILETRSKQLLIEENPINISIYSPQSESHQKEEFQTINVTRCSSINDSPMPIDSSCSEMNSALIDMNEVNNKLNEFQKNGGQFNANVSYDIVSSSEMNDMWSNTTLKLHQTESASDSSEMKLLLHEDEPFIKLHLEFTYGSRSLSICKLSTKINTSETSCNGVCDFESGAIKVHYSLVKNGEVASNFGYYDYDPIYDYTLNVGNIEIKNGYFLNKIENC